MCLSGNLINRTTVGDGYPSLQIYDHSHPSVSTLNPLNTSVLDLKDMNKKVVIVLGLIVVVAAFVSQSRNRDISAPNPSSTVTSVSPTPSVAKLPYKATFAIFTNGTLRVFTDPRYHRLSPDVYLDASDPGVLNITVSDITWADFFATLPMQLSAQCLTTGTGQSFCTGKQGKLSFYLNGSEVPQALDEVIRPGDRLLVTYGNPTPEVIRDQLSRVPVLE